MATAMAAVTGAGPAAGPSRKPGAPFTRLPVCGHSLSGSERRSVTPAASSINPSNAQAQTFRPV